MEKNPEKVVFDAVQGMMPKNRLGREMLRDLKVFSGAKHTHEAQKPEHWDLDNLRGEK